MNEPTTDASRLSRLDVETLCVLHAVGQGCSGPELAQRLGLSPELGATLARGLDPLVQSGWLHVELDRIHITEPGRQHLAERLRSLEEEPRRRAPTIELG